MGADGGTIPKRGEQIKVKKRKITLDSGSIARVRWTTCSVSSLPLKPPIIACDPLGNLMNWEPALEVFLDPDKRKEFKKKHKIKTKKV